MSPAAPKRPCRPSGTGSLDAPTACGPSRPRCWHHQRAIWRPGSNGTRNGRVSACPDRATSRWNLLCSPSRSPTLAAQPRDVEPTTCCVVLGRATTYLRVRRGHSTSVAEVARDVRNARSNVIVSTRARRRGPAIGSWREHGLQGLQRRGPRGRAQGTQPLDQSRTCRSMPAELVGTTSIAAPDDMTWLSSA